MILTKAKLDEAQEIEFQMDVFGTSEQAENVRFVIEGKAYDISIPCSRDGNTVKASVPKLKGILESGVHTVRMEVILDGKVFTPLKESIEFEPLVEVDMKASKASVKEEVKVQVKSVVVSEDKKPKSSKSKLEENLRTVLSEGYDVTKINGDLVIKTGEMYLGIVTETEIKRLDKPLNSYSDLKKKLG